MQIRGREGKRERERERESERGDEAGVDKEWKRDIKREKRVEKGCKNSGGISVVCWVSSEQTLTTLVSWNTCQVLFQTRPQKIKSAKWTVLLKKVLSYYAGTCQGCRNTNLIYYDGLLVTAEHTIFIVVCRGVTWTVQIKWVGLGRGGGVRANIGRYVLNKRIVPRNITTESD